MGNNKKRLGYCNNVQWRGYTCINEYYITKKTKKNNNNKSDEYYVLTKTNNDDIINTKKTLKKKLKRNKTYRFDVLVNEKICMKLVKTKRSKLSNTVICTSGYSGPLIASRKETRKTKKIVFIKKNSDDENKKDIVLFSLKVRSKLTYQD